MKNLFIVIICAIVLAAVVYVIFSLRKKAACNGECCSCCGCGVGEDKAYAYAVEIDGMSCEHCKARVEAAFNAIEGCDAVVNLEEKTATVHSKKALTDEEIKKTVEDLGFTYLKHSEI